MRQERRCCSDAIDRVNRARAACQGDGGGGERAQHINDHYRVDRGGLFLQTIEKNPGKPHVVFSLFTSMPNNEHGANIAGQQGADKPCGIFYF
jgi:hypothetical protein